MLSIHNRTSERGQALILITLAAIGLFAFAALAIDGSKVYSQKRHAQNAADTSVLAAALAKARGNDPIAAARARATSNGFTDGVNNTLVLVNICNDPGLAPPACEGMVAGHESEYIRVRIVKTIPATFGRIIGRNSVTTAVEAIARVQGSASGPSGSSWGDGAMVGINDMDSGICFRMNGGAYVYTHNSGIAINCSSEDAITLMSNMQLRMDEHGTTVGCWNDSTGRKQDTTAIHDPIDCHTPSSTPKHYTAADFASVPTMPAVPACPGHAIGGLGTSNLTEGTYNGNLVINQNTTFAPGVYCITGGINLNLSPKLTGSDPDHPVKIVTGGNINLQNGEIFDFKNLEVYSVDSTFRIGKGTLKAERLRFYSSGKGDFTVEALGNVTSQNTYIYLAEGNISWQSGAKLTMHAAPKDDPEGVGGLLIYKPYKPPKTNGQGGDSTITLNGDSNVVLYGTFLVPGSPIILNGGTGFTLHSQIIGWDYIVNGGAKADIWYDPNDNYTPAGPSNAILQLTK